MEGVVVERGTERGKERERLDLLFSRETLKEYINVVCLFLWVRVCVCVWG